MRAYRTLILSVIVALVIAVPAVAAAKQLIIGGSTSVLPLMQKLAAAYHKAYPKIPAPRVSGGQSDIGISGANNGTLDIGDSSRDPIIGVDPEGLVFTKLARDGVCIITNRPQPPVRSLPAAGGRHLHGQDPRLERSAGSEASPVRSTCSSAPAHPVPRTPSSTSSSANT